MKIYVLVIITLLVLGSVQAQELKVIETDVSDRIMKVPKFESLGEFRKCVVIEQKYLDGCGYNLKLTNKCTIKIDVWWATEMKDGSWTTGVEPIAVGKTKVSFGCIQTGRYVVLTKKPDDFSSQFPTQKELKTILANN